MINLIPPAAKRGMKREYWMRVLVVWLFIGMVVLAVAAVLLVPSLVLVDSQLRAFATQLQTAAQAAEQQEALTDMVRDVNTQARAVAALGAVPSLNQYIDRVRAVQGPAITISNISIRREEDASVAQLTLTGTAASRSSLTGFSNALVADPLFSKADVPLENLAANENITFSLTVVVTPNP